ncbi:hypothetical protein F4813DRAFT_349681, partial [Daldinia decipiens]|uniref:uncharacterized protein n=1 Tax=Daldinia decipiens TaxID=326647 RepID=UPI0020C535BC
MDIFYEEGDITSLILEAASKENIGIKRTRRKVRRLLKRCAKDLKTETRNKQQKAAAILIRSFSTDITRYIFSGLNIDSKKTRFQHEQTQLSTWKKKNKF